MRCMGTSVIQGVSRLAHKESDRGITLQEEFGKMGIEVKLQDDIMLVTGGTGVHVYGPINCDAVLSVENVKL